MNRLHEQMPSDAVYCACRVGSLHLPQMRERLVHYMERQLFEAVGCNPECNHKTAWAWEREEETGHIALAVWTNDKA